MEFINSENIKELSNPGIVSRQLINPENSKSERVTITEVHLEVGACQPRHKHDTSEQIWYAIQGTGKLLLAEEKYHALLHQRVSKIIAQEEYGITDSVILNAIECHTTLRKNASLYDKVVFIADKISWDSKGIPSYDDLLKSGSVETLDEACYLYIKYQFDNNLLVMPHQWLIEAYEDLS